MNSHDSARVQDLLLQSGYSLVAKPEEADVLLFNTCSVRQHAEDRVFGSLGQLKKLKMKRPEIVFGILGCMAESQKDRIFRKLPHVDFLCGPADLDKIPEILSKIQNGAGHLIYLEGYRSKKIPEFSAKRSVSDHVLVKIMEGCENFCSYCIVPYVRGPERSRPSKEIFYEVQLLVNKGVKDVMLLGQNVNSYGKGLKEKIDFPGLLKKIDKIVNEKTKVTFITSHPKDASPELFRTMVECESVLRKLHLPLQSGSNKILKRMNRNYTVEKYKKLVKEYRSIVKDSEIQTDLIVGFPGETKKDFEDTLKAVKEIQFDAAYIFKYSPRPYAAASKMKDDVPLEEKERRHALLLETQRLISTGKKHKIADGRLQIKN